MSGLANHPAVRAWKKAQPGRPVPKSLEELRTKRKSQVFKLHGVGEGGTSVIAKRCRNATAIVERILYEEIVPHLGLPHSAFYGFVHEDTRRHEDSQVSWLLIEDFGDQQYSNADEGHRAAAAKWLGALHAFPIGEQLRLRLPNRGAACCWARMEQARGNIEKSRGNPALTHQHWNVLGAVLAHFETVRSQWGGFLTFSARLPTTVTHGDLHGRHSRIRVDSGGLAFQALDWEHAGVGFPGVDLRYFDAHWATPEIETYFGAMSGSWPDCRLEDVPQMVNVGKLFRHISKISWASTKIAGAYVEGGVEEMRIYEAGLARVIREAPWKR